MGSGLSEEENRLDSMFIFFNKKHLINLSGSEANAQRSNNRAKRTVPQPVNSQSLNAGWTYQHQSVMSQTTTALSAPKLCNIDYVVRSDVTYQTQSPSVRPPGLNEARVSFPL